MGQQTLKSGPICSASQISLGMRLELPAAEVISKTCMKTKKTRFSSGIWLGLNAGSLLFLATYWNACSPVPESTLKASTQTQASGLDQPVLDRLHELEKLDGNWTCSERQNCRYPSITFSKEGLVKLGLDGASQDDELSREISASALPQDQLKFLIEIQTSGEQLSGEIQTQSGSIITISVDGEHYSKQPTSNRR